MKPFINNFATFPKTYFIANMYRRLAVNDSYQFHTFPTRPHHYVIKMTVISSFNVIFNLHFSLLPCAVSITISIIVDTGWNFTYTPLYVYMTHFVSKCGECEQRRGLQTLPSVNQKPPHLRRADIRKAKYFALLWSICVYYLFLLTVSFRLILNANFSLVFQTL